MSLIARYLEENGIPTVVIGAARDIVEHCGVARFVFTDFPLGSPCGEPYNVTQQRELFQKALDLLETAKGPRTGPLPRPLSRRRREPLANAGAADLYECGALSPPC